ncbi:radical SAM protein [bacterium]|nr:radical SAM protein [bacterium]
MAITVKPGRPSHCVWELTLKCNMRCKHCGSYAGKDRVGEMTLEQLLDVADQLADIGVKRITLSGGEPLLRENWDQIAQRLIERGVRVGMISNGYFMTDNIDKLVRLKALKAPGCLEVVAMSVDGLRETHDDFRRVPGSWDRIKAGYKALHEAGIYTAAITSVSNNNIKELDEMLKMFMSWKVNAWQLQTLFGGGRMREFPELMPGPAGVETVARFIAQTRLNRYPILVFPADCLGFCTELDPFILEGPWQGCQAGITALGIEANGNVKGCLSLCPELQENNPFVEGNLHEEKLIDIWNKPGAFAYNREFEPSKAEGFCATCRHLERCRCGCSAQAYFATGTVNNNPYCMLAERDRKAKELRAQAEELRCKAASLEKQARQVLHPERPYPQRIVRNRVTPGRRASVASILNSRFFNGKRS